MFGDATSPFITGFIRDQIKKDDEDYDAFLYSLLTTLIILTGGAIAFLYSAKYYVRDVEKCREAVKREDLDESVSTNANNLTDFARMS